MLDSVKFLIVDDHPFSRETVSIVLKAAGARNIDFARDGSDALHRIRDGMPDVVITDLLMTGVDGIDLVRMIRQSSDSPNPYLPVIMLSGRADLAAVKDARDAGVTEFVSKPISAAKLLSRIEAVILRPRPFTRTAGFFGPCRRRGARSRYSGPDRRTSQS